MDKVRVFADTNVIIEAFRTKCWLEIARYFSIETVEKCLEETQTGNPSNPYRVSVDLFVLQENLSERHTVSRTALAALIQSYPTCQLLDDGEMHLFAFLHSNDLLRSADIILTTADKAALAAANKLGLFDNLKSLEYLAKRAGVSREKFDALALQFREDWLGSIKTQIILGTIPGIANFSL